MINDIFRKSILRLFLGLASISIVLALIISFFIFRHESKNSIDRLQSAEKNKLQLQVNEIINDFKFIQRDVLFLRDLVAINGICSCSDKSEFQILQDEFYRFLNQEKQYDQLRLIDNFGMEQIRIQNSEGKTVMVGEDLLQDKSDRYYFQEIYNLTNVDLYFSKFDLNVENDQIEFPNKPVIRIGMKVPNCEGDFCGIILVNYLGQALIDNLNNLNLNAPSILHLLDPKGYFLISPNEKNNWGFMFQEREDKIYSNLYAEAWETIQSEKEGQIRNKDGLFTFNTMTFSNSENGLITPNLRYFAKDDYWKIVSFVPAHELVNLNKQIISKLYFLVFLIIFLSLVLSFAISYFTVKGQETKKQISDKNKFLSNVINSFSEPFYVLCPKNSKVYLANKAAYNYSIKEDGLFKNNTIISSPEDNDKIANLRSEITKTKSPQSLELEVKKADNSIQFIEINGYPVLDNNSKVAQIIEVINNKTAEKLSEIKFKDLLASAPDGMIITNARGEIEMVNKQAEKLFQYPEKELVGEKIEILIPNRFTRHIDYRENYRYNPRPRYMGIGLELYGLKSTGEEFPVEISLSPIQTSEGILFSSAIRDITERKKIEEEINKLALVAKHTNNAVIITNNKGEIEWVNQAFESLTEYSLSEVLGKKPGHILQGKGTSQITKDNLSNAIKNKQEIKVEIVNYTKSGKEYWQSLTIQPINGHDSSESKFIGLGIDVTEKITIEKALKNSEKQLKFFVKHTPAAVAMLDKQMDYLVVSDRWYKDYKIESQNIIGKCHYDIFPEINNMPEWKEHHQRCLKGEVYKKEEDLFIREDGTISWLRYELHPWYNDSNQIGGIIMFTEDITTRKEIENEVFEQAQILKQIVESVVATNLEGFITFWNKGAQELFGYSKEEILGKHIKILYPEDERDLQFELMTNRLSDHKEHNIEVRRQKKSGEIFIGYMSIAPQRDRNDKIVGMIDSIIDITENKKILHELERKQELLNEAQRVAHLGSWDWDIPSNKVTWSDEVFNIFGVDRTTYQESFEGYISFIPADEVDKIKSLIDDGIQNKTGFRLTHKIILKNNTFKYLDLIWNIELNDENEVIRFFGTVLDITDSKIAQEELENKQFLLNEAQRIAQLGSWQWDIKNDKLSWSDELYNIYGVDPKHFKADYKTYMSFLDKEDAIESTKRVQKAIKTKKGYTAKHKITLKNGTVKFIDTKVNIGLNTQGEVVRLYGTALDITATVKTQEELEHNQFLLNEAQKNAHLGSWEWNFTHNKLTFSDELYRIFSLNPESFKVNQHNFMSLTEINGESIVTKKIQEAIATKSAFRIKHKVILKNGTIKYLESKGDVGLDNNGEVVRVYGTALDITAIVKAEEEIRKLNENLEQKVVDRTAELEKANIQIAANEKKIKLLKEIASTAYAANTEEQVYNIAVQKFAEYINWPIGHMYIMDEVNNILKPSNVWYFSDNNKQYDEFKNVTNEFRFRPNEGLPGKALALKTTMYIKDVNNDKGFLRTKKLKNLVIRSAIATPVIINSKVVAVLEYFQTEIENEDKIILDIGRQIGIELGYVIDRKKAENALRESEEKFRQLAENIDQVLWLSANEKVLYISPSYEKVFERKTEEIYNNQQTIFDSIHPEDIQQFQEKYFKDYLQNKNSEMEFRILLPGGRIKWIRGKIFIFKGSERDMRTVGIAEDITELKKLSNEIIEAKNEAEKANNTKSEFLANMSHEIRTPMNAIIGFSEQLSNTITEKKQLSQINSIRSSGKNLLRIINDILDLSKIEAGKIEIDPVPVNLNKMASEIKNIFSQKVQEKGIYMHTVLGNHIPKAVLIDEVRFRQILFNLIGNAVKFTDTGHVLLSIDCRKNNSEDENVDLTIIVEDTGIGIPVDQQEIIFDPFSQQPGQSVVKYGGTGLGLSITKKLIEKMGGSISLESEVGFGSKFRIDLTGVPISDVEIDFENKAFDTSKVIFEPAKVLVVDDNAENRKLIMDLLEASSLILFQADNGNDAINLAKEQLPDLILMDLRMPVMDGYKATEILKNDKRTKSIPIMALTASMKNVTESENINKLFDEYLLKPIDIAAFFNKMKKYLKYKIIDSNSSPAKNITGYKLSKEQKKLLPGFIDIIESEFIPEYEKVYKNQVINDIERFGKKLFTISEKFGYQIIIDYCDEIASFVESFEFGKLMNALKKFPELVNSLKNEI